MYRILGKVERDNGVFYAIASDETDIEILYEKELNLLFSISQKFYDTNNKEILSLTSLDVPTISLEDTQEEWGTEEDEWSSEEEVDEVIEDWSNEEDIDEIYEDLDYNYDWEDDEEWTEEEENEVDLTLSIMDRLREYLTKEQLYIIQRYYLWYTKRVFDIKSDYTLFKRTLREKYRAKKLEVIKQIKDTGNWVFGGIYFGNWRLKYITNGRPYTCNLGHRIGKVYFGVDTDKITLEHKRIRHNVDGRDYDIVDMATEDIDGVIRFGSTCASDFFDLPKEVMGYLNKVTTDAETDLGTILRFYENKEEQEVSDSFKLLDEYIGLIKLYNTRNRLLKIGEDVINQEILDYYNDFRANNILPPKSIIQNLRSYIVGWMSKDEVIQKKWTGHLRSPSRIFYDNFIIKVLGSSCSFYEPYREIKPIDTLTCSTSMRVDANDLLKSVSYYIYTLFCYELSGVYKFNAGTNKDEGGTSRGVRHTLQAYYRFANSIEPDMGYSFNVLTRLVAIISSLKQFMYKYQGVLFLYRYCIGSKPEFKSPVIDNIINRNNFYDLDVRLRDIQKRTGVDATPVLNLLLPLTEQLDNLGKLINNLSYLKDNKDNTIAKFEDVLNRLNSYDTAKLKDITDDFIVDVEKKYGEILDQEEKERQEREQKELEEKQNAELEKQQEQLEKARVSSEYKLELIPKLNSCSDITDTIKELRGIDFDKLGHKPLIAIGILATLKNGKLPTERQMYHLNELHKYITGTDIKTSENTRLELKDIPDGVSAIELMFSDPTYIDKLSKLISRDNATCVGVLRSIKTYRKVSEKQKKYIDGAITILKEEQNNG